MASFYSYKDQHKANVANKYIGIGADGSATDKYRVCYGPMANCSLYDKSDVVFISINGRRKNAVKVDAIKNYIELAAQAEVRFVTDNKINRYREYNTGERDVEELLLSLNYKELETPSYSLWIKDN
jgi:hypothetical protein